MEHVHSEVGCHDLAPACDEVAAVPRTWIRSMLA